MIIAIDGYEANVQNRVGIGRYAYEILRHVSEIATSNVFRVYLPNVLLPDMPEGTDRWKYRIAGPQKLWTFVGLPLALTLDQSRTDVVFSPTHYVPRWISTPRVMAIMDLSYLEYPHMFRPRDLHQLIHWTGYSVRHARAILTISQFSKRAIINAYGVPERRIVVTYPGLTMPVTQTKGKDLGDYILSVGTLQPRKNFARLVEAFSRIASKYPDLTLVIVGKKGWLFEEILAAPKKHGVAQRVKFLDFVSDSDLSALYKNAKAFALPSLYEGFGLPVLEAMSFGTPVVVSDTSSLPEIAGEAGIYVDPESVESIADGLTKALSETGDAAKKRTVVARKQVEKFTWEKAAKQTLEVLEKVGKGEL
ncbi:glycosyltransferase family 4 protein [Candidatus Gottesmanbacteria bacterium]|nr:glycosyltransferase family 4 protein [Candidatus Gottesmanbacteria bacterium]